MTRGNCSTYYKFFYGVFSVNLCYRRFLLPTAELDRIQRLLQRSVDKEAGKEVTASDLSEDNPDGCEIVLLYFPYCNAVTIVLLFAVDISIYKDEDQLKELERKKKQQEREKAKAEKKAKVRRCHVTDVPVQSKLTLDTSYGTLVLYAMLLFSSLCNRSPLLERRPPRRQRRRQQRLLRPKKAGKRALRKRPLRQRGRQKSPFLRKSHRLSRRKKRRRRLLHLQVKTLP